MKLLRQRILGAVLSITMVSSVFSLVTFASETQLMSVDNTDASLVTQIAKQKPADYDNELYFENFDGDTELDTDTTLKYGKASVTVQSGDSNLTEDVETEEYLELSADTVGQDLTFGVEYEAATSPVESKYPASMVDKLVKMQASFDLCPVDIDRLVNVSFRDKLTTANTKAVNLMAINANGTFSFSKTSETYSYTEGKWVSIDFYFDFSNHVYSVYIDDVAVFKDVELNATLDKCIEAFVFQAGSLAEGQKYKLYVDNMRIAIPKKFEVVSSVPVSGSTGVGVSEDIVITMSHEFSNFDPELVAVTGGSNLPEYTVLENDGVITISFDGDLEYGKEYTVILDKSLANEAGTTLGTEDKVIKFTTYAPKFEVVSSVPASGSTGVGVGEDIIITMTDKFSNFQPELVTVTGGSNLPEYTVSENNGVITISFDDNLEQGTEYTVTLDKSLADINGTTLGTEDKVIKFTTYEAIFEIKSSVPTAGNTSVDVGKNIVITMTDKILNFQPELVTVTGGTALPEYAVSESNGVIIISFDGDLEYETEYTITLKKEMTSISGITLGTEDKVIRFTTCKKILKYGNELYFEDFDGDFILDADTTLKYGKASVTVQSGDSNLTEDVETGEYLELTADTVSHDLTFGVEYETATSPVESKYPASKVDELVKMQASFDLCPVDIDKQILVWFRDKLTTETTKNVNLMTIETNGTFTFANTNKTYSYTGGIWVSVDFYFDFSRHVYSAYINNEAVLEDVSLPAALDKCIEAFVFQASALSEGQKYTFYVDNMRIAIPEKFEMASSVPASGSTAVGISDDIIITMTDKISNFHPSLVTVSGGTILPGYEVSEKDGVITISFDRDLEYGTEYTVTMDKSIANMAGITLGSEDRVIKFTTCERKIVYNNDLYFEDFDGDTGIDEATTMKYGTSTALVKSGDSDLTTEVETGEYLELKDETVTGKDSLTFGVEYEADTSPVESKYPASKVDELVKTQVSFELCPVDVDKQVYIYFRDKLSTTSTKSANLMTINPNGTFTFSKTTQTYTYTEGKWVSIDFYFDFSRHVYSVYIDDVALFSDVELGTTLDKCVESLVFQAGVLSVGEKYTLYVDNMRIAIPKKFEVMSSSPVEDSTSVNVTDDVKIVLSNELDKFHSGLVTVTGGTTTPLYNVVADKETITVSFTGNMNFNTEYTVTLSKDIRDIYGNTLGVEDKVIKFKTILEQITSSIPKFADKVSATVVNPAGASITPTLVVVVKNADGSVDILTDDMSDASGSKYEVNFDSSSLIDGQAAFAFVTDGISSLNLLRDVVASPDSVFVSEESEVTASLNVARLVGNELTLKGTLSSPVQKNIIIKVMNESNKPEFIMPVQTDENGEFSYIIPADALSFEEKYSISITGYNMEESNKKSIYNLSVTEKNRIKTGINGASSASGMKTLLLSAEYREKMNLAGDLYNENTYNTLYEQQPYDSFDDIIEMIYKADSLLEEINTADWSDYTGIFENNSNIVFPTAGQLEKYKGYSANQKNAINKIIIDSSPFSTFNAVRTAFDSAVKKYTDSLSTPSGGSGGGGGGGGGGGASSTKKEDILGVDTSTGKSELENNNNVNMSNKLFTDMSVAVWALESVKELYSRGIVSESEYFRPMDNVTREEFVKMLVQLAGLQLNTEPKFTDVKGDEWFTPYLGAAQSSGIVQGSDNGAFGVGQFITRQDMVVMVQRALTAMNKTVEAKSEEIQFADGNEISEYAISAVSMMQRAGIVSGMGNGSFEPKGVASRAQAAVIISNLINAMK